MHNNYFKYFQEFGLKICVLKILCRYSSWIEKKYEDSIIKYLERNYNHLLDLRTYNGDLCEHCEKIIWTMWWQGKENMPGIIKKCINSVIENKPDDTELIIIDKDNYKNYLYIPEHIQQKLDLGMIDITHFSDYYRYALLTKYGGLWIDASFYAPYKFRYDFNINLFSPRMKNISNIHCISKGRWIIGYWGSLPMEPITMAIYFCLNQYWEDHKVLLDYFLTDYFLDILYRSNIEARDIIDRFPCTGDSIFALEKSFNQPYDNSKYKKMLNMSQFHRISWKKHYEKVNGDTITNYNYWMNTTE